MQSKEQLRDLLLELQAENANLRVSATHGKLLLAGLDTLLTVGRNTDPFEVTFQSLRQVYDYKHAFALLQSEDKLICTAYEGGHVPSDYAQNIGVWRRYIKRRTIATKIYRSNSVLVSADDAKNIPEDEVDAFPALFIPIKVSDGQGALVLTRDREGAEFDRNDVHLGQKFALLASHAISIRDRNLREEENTRLQELTQELEYRAFFDELTGKANRALIQQKVESALKNRSKDKPLGIAFFDVNKFKRINDYYGHEIGDILLQEFANRIGEVVRDCDTVGRLSGDEFILLVEDLKDRDDFCQLIERITHIVAETYHIGGHNIETSASVGVSFFPEHGTDYETLRRNADNAMYRAKQAAKTCPVYFNNQMAEAQSVKMELETRLRKAIREKQFLCMFQPKVCLKTGRICSFEALVRWQDEHGEIHAPGSFIELATELGLLDEISRFVLEACIEAFEILDPVFGDKTLIALNIAGAQANDIDFMKTFIARIVAAGCNRRIMLEITEDVMVTTAHFKKLVKPLLKASKIKVSIDDFGTGYSSIAAMTQLEVDELKVDRSFISDIHNTPLNQKILSAIEHMAQAMELPLVAEGIETADELRYLQEQSTIQTGQGFYFSRPVLAQELIEIAQTSWCRAGKYRLAPHPDAFSMGGCAKAWKRHRQLSAPSKQSDPKWGERAS
ncbi:putative bifunctional diguanylate cyclase/phosphodiesterase [Hirschia litorea]|uniref:Bifunctional diguanylate cyclase/phosphodiesterase n=1 Tax=Hirschia litorea TaxID=1199156 RepID=A0ABW2IKN0_9PROT